MPAFNEEDSIASAIDDVERDVLSIASDAEFIIVDDGSTDATAQLVRNRVLDLPGLKLIQQENGGHGPALIAGMNAAEGETLLLLDSDRQISLQQFGEHWKAFNEQDLIAFLGVRMPRHDPFHRLIITRLMRYLIAFVFGASPEDGGAPYKMVRKTHWNLASKLIAPKSWIPSVLLAVYLLQNYKDRVVEHPIHHVERAHGQSTLNMVRLIKFCSAAALEVFSFRAKSRRRNSPLQ